MSQINPYRGIVVPTPRPQEAKPHKDRREGKKRDEHREPADEEDSAQPREDGEEHLDLKA
jgi:hypothetical protein